MAANYDQVALNWVKPEVDSTLEQAKQSLESFSESREDVTQLRHCQSCLHQVQGTLTMLEIVGGSMLAEEMDLLTDHIIENQDAVQQEAYEVLMRAILHLPIYLERLLSGHNDDPLIILPMLNELRVQRGANEVLESQFFNVDLEIEPENGPEPSELPENFDFQREATDIRHAYQRALLNIIKGQNADAAAEDILRGIKQLEMYTATDPIGTQWWVAHGFLLAIMESNSLADKEVKSILGKIERRIRALQDNPQEVMQQKPDQAILNMMLFHISKSESDEPLIQTLKSEFKLDQQQERSNKVARQQIKMAGPDQDAMITVANVMREDLANIKDTLDIYVRSKDKDASVLEQLVPGLQQISDTLVMLELEAVSTLVREQITKINEALTASEAERDQVIIDVAGTLLYIDASITSKSKLDLDDDDDTLDDAERMASGLAYEESKQIIIKESRAGLQSAKDSIIEYITNDWNDSFLEEVPHKLQEVSGACRLIEYHVPADLIEHCAKLIQTRALEQKVVLKETVLDALADVLTSIDYFLESLQSGLAEGLQSVLEAASLSCQVIILELSKTTESETEKVTPSQAPEEILKDDKETDESLIDDELIEIFLEEAEEVLETLKEHLPRWIHDNEQHEDLTVSRRSFHTLKGSGRMVGAQDIGELAWSIENLLNKIIEGSQRPTEAILQVVTLTQSILPGLVEDFRAQRQPHINLLPIEERANALAIGEGHDIEWHHPSDESVEAAEQQEEPSEESIPDEEKGDLDPELLEIFASEAEEHIATCQAFYDQNADLPVKHKPDDGLLRALHTLKGSARMAGILTLGDLITDVEGYFKELKIRNLTVSDQAFELLSAFNQLLMPYINSLEQRLEEPEQHDERATVQQLANDLKETLSSDKPQEEAEDVAEDSDERTPESVQQLLMDANELLMTAEEQMLASENTEQVKQGVENLIDSLSRVNELAENAKEPEIQTTAQKLQDFSQKLQQAELPDNSFAPLKSGYLAGITSLLNMLDIVAAEQSVSADDQFNEQLADLSSAVDTADFSALVDTSELTLEDTDEVTEEETEEATEETPDAIDLGALDLSALDDDDDDSSEQIDEAEDDFEDGLAPPPPVEETLGGDVLYELEDDEASEEAEADAAEDEVIEIDADLVAELDDADDVDEPSEVDDADEIVEEVDLSIDELAGDLELEPAEDEVDEASEETEADVAEDEVIEIDADLVAELDDADDVDEPSEVDDANEIVEEVDLTIDELAGDLELEPAEDEVDEASEETEADVAEDEVIEIDADLVAELDDADDVDEPSEVDDADEIIEEVDLSIDELAGDLELEPAEDEVDEASEESEVDAAEEYDPEILEIAIEEGHEILERTQPLLDDWKNNPTNLDVVATLQRELHTLKGAARMGGVTPMGDFAHKLEDIYESLAENRLEATPALIDLCIASQDILMDMVEALEATQPLPSADQLLQEINSVVNPEEETAEEETAEEETAEEEIAEEEIAEEEIAEEEIAEEEIAEEEIAEEEIAEEEAAEEEAAEEEAAEEEAAEEEAAEEEAAEEEAAEEEAAEEEAAEEVVIPVVMDEDGLEILDIFLEEAREIIDSLEATISDWQSSPTNLEHVGLMQRNLHTLKGGARLSELNLLGDLSHHLETLYESVAEGRRNTTDNLFQLSFDARDTFSRLVNEISEQQQMTVPVEFIQSLEQEIDESILQEYQSIEAEASSEVEESAEVEESVEVEDTSVTTEVADEPEAVDEEAGEQDADTAEEPETEEVEPEQPEPVAKADLELPPLDQTMPFVPVTHQDTFKAAKAQQAKKAARRKTSGEQVKVGSETLEDMVNLASESSILRSRLEQQVNTLQNNLEEMGSTIERLRTQLRAMEVETDAQIQYRQEQAGPDMDEFDPLEMDRYTRQQELARGMSESSNDLVNLKDNFLDLASEAEALLIQQGQINTELQERLIDTRMEPFDSIVPRLQRMVRQISKELKKDINIKITADGEMDRTVLEKMVSPIEHMMRNAIDHGIESPKERSKLGKDKQGKIRIKLAREGAQVVISISDDGRGINIDKVREKAVERGLITEDAELSKTEIFNLIFTAGVSTADEVTQISGRGVGMDVVFSEIKQLGGYVEVESEPNEGSNFMVRLPFTVSVNNALMVMVNEEAFAVPLTNIEGIVTVSPYELEELYKLDEPVYEYAGIEYELNYLGTMLERNKKPDFENILKPLPVMLVHGIEKPVAIQLDGLIGSREVVVKSLGAQLSSISGLSGATILGDGSVVLILDIPSLWRRMNSEQDEDSELEAAAEYDEDYVPTVMVVDDSITVRKVTSRLLERNNFDVMTAKDGVDASTKLQDEQPDIILLDIEMPKMDGFELATIVKSDDELKHIPIIMITSRTGEKHKERAMNIGVEDFMGKPFAEDALLQRIDELIAKKRG